MAIVILIAGTTIPAISARRGDFPRWIVETVGPAWTGSWQEHDLRSEARIPSPEEADGFIITGSASSVTERAPWMLRAEELLRGLVARDAPLFGICFGHQMIAEALGGQVSRNPQGREIGTVPVIRVADDPIFRSVPGSFEANETHVDSVLRLPKESRLLATTALDGAAAFAVGERTRAVQFHPEIDADAMRGYITARAHLMRDEGLDPDASLSAVREAPHAQDVLRNFVREIVRPRRR